MADLLAAVNGPAAIPNKKRKASNASSANSHQSAATTVTTHSRISSISCNNNSFNNDNSNHRSNGSSNASSGNAHKSSIPIEERRLPAKKRKNTLGEDACKQQQHERQLEEQQEERHKKNESDSVIVPVAERPSNDVKNPLTLSNVHTFEFRKNNKRKAHMRTRAEQSTNNSFASLRKESNDSSSMDPPPARGRASSNETGSRVHKSSLDLKISGKDSHSDSSSTIRRLSTDLVAFDEVPRKESLDSANALKLDDVLLAPADTLLDLKALDQLVALNSNSNSINSTTSNTNQQLSERLSDFRVKSNLTDDDSYSNTSSGQRLLFEAAILVEDQSLRGGGGGENEHFYRDRLDSWGDRAYLLANGVASRDRLDSWEAPLSRDRLESWGGVSDISLPFLSLNGSGGNSNPSTTNTAFSTTAAATAANEGSGENGDGNIPHKIHLQQQQLQYQQMGRARLNSIASLSEGSFMEDMSDIQAFVAAAVASVGDQLAELAEAVEKAVGIDNLAYSQDSNDENDDDDMDYGSDHDVGPVIGATIVNQRPRSLSQSSGRISVDYEAVTAAVHAAQSVTGNLDIANIDYAQSTSDLDKKPAAKKKSQARPLQRKLPLNKNLKESTKSTKKASSISEQEKTRIRELARSSVTPIPPKAKKPVKAKSSSTKSKTPKKRARDQKSTPSADVAKSASLMSTPKQSNKSTVAPEPEEIPMLPLSTISSDARTTTTAAATAAGQACQKWESMYSSLLEFVEERRQEETKDLTEEEKAQWIWDGNVPTTHRTKDGKALGRWVNNQRSAKGNGKLRADREDRLLDAGLKWSVMTPNSWNEMLDELRIYIREQTKNGKSWDGNVPTNYQIKSKGNGKFRDEDKNLGRWVNRQRSLFHSGKLRKDRQQDLEKIGLKWSMLAMNSWDSMFESLSEYVDTKESKGIKWDGNVPANYKTNDDPPRALGRWINRQRSAYIKGKLKEEYIDKLNKIGLKWSIIERSADSDKSLPKVESNKTDKVTSSNQATFATINGNGLKSTDGAKPRPSNGENRVVPDFTVSVGPLQLSDQMVQANCQSISDKAVVSQSVDNESTKASADLCKTNGAGCSSDNQKNNADAGVLKEAV